MNKIRVFFKRKLTNEKDILIFKNMLASFLIKGGALVVSLVTMPAYIRYFENQEVLGIWFTVLSVMTWILAFDLGIGNGLRNKLVEAITKNDKVAMKNYISSAYIIIGGTVAITIFIGYILAPSINWNNIFNVSESVISKETMLFAVRSVFIGVMLQFLFKLITSILYALQKAALPNFLALITSISQLIIVLVAPTFDSATNLKMLSLIYVLCVNVPLIVATIIVFRTSLKNCEPSISSFSKQMAFDIMKLGGVFFWVQIMFMVLTNTNEFFISKLFGPAYVVDYQIYNRLFTLVGQLFALALTPMWSAITKAYNEKDFTWLRKTYKLLNYTVLIAVACEILLIPILQILVNIWLGENTVTINYTYAMVFAVYGSIIIYQSVLSTLVCGMGKMKLQTICYTIAVIIKFLIILIGIKVFDNWLIVIVANIIVFLPYCVLQPIWLKKEFRKS
ncbi:lipopolysaccharide biosynthesis protein [Paenibacillus sp. FSL L8-0708]|uniref:lipopolysaccharide biosynthesis protein n=1 Tax=Paenibacillus sp. FSL L8-0708 TaxID=2975311 RepID=UPI0030FB4F53